MWETTGHGDSLATAVWPVFNENLAREEAVELPVQVNGKLRSKVLVAPDADNDAMREAALADPRVSALVAGKEVAKVIVVPGRLVNVVVR
jgi:leucyl-tRNA synthetase